MYTSKEKVINVQIKDGNIIHFKACVDGLFTQKLTTQVLSLILIKFPLMPTITYTPLKKSEF